MKLAAMLLTTACCSVHAHDCRTYGTEATLRGVLTKRTFPEQPNYESIAKGDTVATYYFLTPATPVCVQAGLPENNEPAERGIRRVQLVFSSEYDGYARLRHRLGKHVACKGSFFHSISGHHHSVVLFQTANCNDA